MSVNPLLRQLMLDGTEDICLKYHNTPPAFVEMGFQIGFRFELHALKQITVMQLDL